jgi:uncharacterized membrane protein YoaK (UPF0700 family)
MVDNATNSAEQMLYGTLLVLTFVSGLVDAASFLALGHVVTVNMTGNVMLMALATAGSPEPTLLRPALALLTALACAVVAGHLDSRIRWEKARTIKLTPLWRAEGRQANCPLTGEGMPECQGGRTHGRTND